MRKALFTIIIIGVIAAGFAVAAKRNAASSGDASKGGSAQSSGKPAGSPGATPAAPPAIAVETAHPRPAEIEQVLDVTGTLDPKVEATVRSEVPGIISEVLVNDWVKVKKGQELAHLDTRDLELQRAVQQAKINEAQARIDKTQAALTMMKTDASRMDDLFKQGVISAKEHEEATSGNSQARADVEMNRAMLNTERATLQQIDLKIKKARIISPIDGVVAMRRANPGLSVGGSAMEDALFKIVDLDHLDLKMSIPMSSLAQVHIGQPVTFTTTALPGREFAAKVTYLNPEANNDTRAIPAIAEVENTSGTLRTGLFVRANIRLGSSLKVLELPLQAALMSDRGAKTASVFVAQGGKAVKKEVQVGVVGERSIQITGGLSVDDEVVTRGAYQLRDGDAIKVASEEKPLDSEKVASAK